MVFEATPPSSPRESQRVLCEQQLEADPLRGEAPRRLGPGERAADDIAQEEDHERWPEANTTHLWVEVVGEKARRHGLPVQAATAHQQQYADETPTVLRASPPGSVATPADAGLRGPGGGPPSRPS